MNLPGKVAVVTGVGAGIGAAVADIFAAAGARIVGLECNAQALDRTARRVAGNPGELHPICAYVSSEQSVGLAFQKSQRDTTPSTFW